MQQVIAHQPRLRAFIRTLLPVRQDADDVLQEVNLVLCRRSADYEKGTSFAAWAMQVAYYQVLAHRQSAARSRLVFEEETLRQLADSAGERLVNLGDQADALRHCLGRLLPQHRQLLARRYSEQQSVKRIADDVDRTAQSVRQSLYRIRSLLHECISRRLRRQEGRP